jgi:hypothetical protein
MHDGTALPATSDPARAARARPLAEREVEGAISELVGIGLKIARAIERRVEAVGDGPEAIAELDRAAMAFGRAARAVRLTLLLRGKLQAAPGAAAAGAGEVKRRAGEIVRRAIEDEFGREAEIERLTAEGAERLEQEFREGAPNRPVGAIVADVCQALGLDPDWRGLASDIAAAESFVAADAEAAEEADDGTDEMCWVGPDGRWTPFSELYPNRYKPNLGPRGPDGLPIKPAPRPDTS